MPQALELSVVLLPCTSGPAEIRRFGAEKFENRLLGSTISFRTSHLQHTKSRRAPGAKPGGQSSNFIEPTALILAGVEG